MSPDLTIDMLLDDPITKAVLKADRLELRAFEATLRMAARRIEAAGFEKTPPFMAHVVSRCRPLTMRGWCSA